MALTPSWFIEFLTEKSWFFASAAEGFFAISGILVGYIYGPRILKNTASVTKKILKRSGLLYVLSVGFTFLYTLWALLANIEPIGLGQPITDTSRLILHTLTLQYSFGWVDFLSRYAVFMLLAPAVLWLVAKRKAWIPLGVSIVVWLLSSLNSSFLPYSSWQIIFMVSIIIGYYLPDIENSFMRLHKPVRHKLFIVITSAGIATYIGAVAWLYSLQFAHQIAPPEHIGIFNVLNILYQNITPIFSRDTIGIGRLAVGILWFTTIYLLFRKYESNIQTLSRGTLELLGTNSLFVYCLQGLLIFAMNLFIIVPEQPNLIINTIVGIGFVICIYWITKIKVNLSKKRIH